MLIAALQLVRKIINVSPECTQALRNAAVGHDARIRLRDILKNMSRAVGASNCRIYFSPERSYRDNVDNILCLSFNDRNDFEIDYNQLCDLFETVNEKYILYHEDKVTIPILKEASVVAYLVCASSKSNFQASALGKIAEEYGQTSLVEVVSLVYDFIEGDFSSVFEEECSIYSPEVFSDRFRLDAIIDASREVILDLTEEAVFTGVGTKSKSLFGESISDLSKRYMKDVLPPDTFEICYAAFTEALASKRPISLEFTWNFSGTRRNFQSVMQPYMSDGRIHILWILRDVSIIGLMQNELRRMGQVVHGMASPVVLFNLNKKILWANKAFEDLFVRIGPGIRGKSLDDIRCSLSSNDTLSTAMLCVSDTHATYMYEDRYLNKNGDPCWLKINLMPLFDDFGAVSGYISVETDLTQSKIQEIQSDGMAQAIGQAHKKLVNALDAFPDGALVFDDSHNLIASNTAFIKIFPFLNLCAQSPVTITDLMGEFYDFQVFNIPEIFDRQSWIIEYGSIITGNYFQKEMRLRDGRWLSIVSRKTIDGGVIILFSDISESKKLRLAIADSQTQLGSILESSVAAIALYDNDGVLVYCNSEAERILQLFPGMKAGNPNGAAGWSLENLDGAPIGVSNSPVALVRNAHGVVRDMRICVRWTNGQRKIITCNGAMMFDADGRHNVVLSFWDVTEQLAATQKLESALKRAEDMSRSKSVFLANMSHEIRTPLNGVLGLAEILHTQLSDPQHKQFVELIRQSGHTLLTVLNSILDMSKIESGNMTLESVPCVLSEIANRLNAVYMIQAEERGLEFEVFCSKSCENPVIGDPTRIEQILHNLLNNAIKFTEYGQVSLSISARPGRAVVFEVSDTGRGLTPEQRARVFNSFEQADVETTRRFGGTGLGLSIVRELVEMMGGEIELESELGQGTSVTVSLPLNFVN